MLTGSDLLARVRERGAISRAELVRSCGYAHITRDGGERLNFTAFYEALLQAGGVALGGRTAGGRQRRGRRGRSLSYQTRVQFNGNLVVGRAYTALLDLRPGDALEIRLGRGQIRLVPHGGSGEDA